MFAVFFFLCILLFIVNYLTVALPERPRTVVIAAAYGYNFMQFKSFIAPLRQVYDGDVVMFVDDNLDKDTNHGQTQPRCRR